MNYEEELKKALCYAHEKQQKQQIHAIKHQNDRPLSFSKVAFIFVMVNCVIIELYSMIIMGIFMDLSALPALISAVVGECICMISYNVKSQIENSSNGLIYEMKMREYEEDAKG